MRRFLPCAILKTAEPFRGALLFLRVCGGRIVNASSGRPAGWKSFLRSPRCGLKYCGSLLRPSRAAQVIQSLSASARAIACRLSLPRDVRAGSACRGTCARAQPAPRVHRYPIALRFPYYTESGHQNQHICLIFSNMCSILEPRALERRQIAAKLADRQSVHAGFGEDPGFCYHAGLPLLLEYKKLCPIIRTVPEFFPGVSSGALGRRKKSGKIRCLSFLSRASRGF